MSSRWVEDDEKKQEPYTMDLDDWLKQQINDMFLLFDVNEQKQKKTITDILLSYDKKYNELINEKTFDNTATIMFDKVKVSLIHYVAILLIFTKKTKSKNIKKSFEQFINDVSKLLGFSTHLIKKRIQEVNVRVSLAEERKKLEIERKKLEQERKKIKFANNKNKQNKNKD
jgi:hypothetical protein